MWKWFLVSLASLCLVSTSAWAYRRPFVVYDALLFTGKPDLTSEGLVPLRVVYTQEFWTTTEICSDPNEADVRAAARQVASEGYRGPTVLDIECSSVDIRFHETADVDSELLNLTQMQGWFQEELVEHPTGLYYQPPISDIRDSDLADPSALRAANDYISMITAQSDVLFPQMYTLDADLSWWKKSTRLKLSEAHRIAPWKPVYPFIWPQYHQIAGPPLALSLIPGPDWAKELDYIYSLGADGVVLWGGYQSPWDDNAPWWKATKAFLKRIHRFSY